MKYLNMALCSIVISLSGCAMTNERIMQEKDHSHRMTEAAKINTQLGLAYLKQGDRSRAKGKLLNALKLAPNSADVNAGFAYYLEQSGDVVRADQYYQKAIIYSANSGAQMNNYGAFLCRNKRYNEADKYFEKAVADVKYLHAAGAYENAGLCAEAARQNDKALAYFRKALKNDPQRKPSLVEALQLLAKQNNNEAALNLIKDHSELTYQDPVLLKQAIKLAQANDDKRMLRFYESRLQTLAHSTQSHAGVENDHG